MWLLGSSDHMQHVAPGHPVAAKPARINVVPDLQHAAPNVCRFAVQKLPYVLAIDRNSPVDPPVAVNRTYSRKLPNCTPQGAGFRHEEISLPPPVPARYRTPGVEMKAGIVVISRR